MRMHTHTHTHTHTLTAFPWCQCYTVDRVEHIQHMKVGGQGVNSTNMNICTLALVYSAFFSPVLRFQIYYTCIYTYIYIYIYIYSAAETWCLKAKRVAKLNSTEMDFWRRSARISRKDKIRNNIIKQKRM